MSEGAMAVLAVAAAVAAGCGGSRNVDAMRAELMDADRAFAAATARRGADGWASYFAAEGRQFHSRGVSIGVDAIRRRMAPAFADTSRRLLWHPVSAVVAASGEVGYTIGRWESRSRGADGVWAATGTGNYVTIWSRQGDGSWKAAVDIGNQDEPPPAAPDAARR